MANEKKAGGTNEAIIFKAILIVLEQLRQSLEHEIRRQEVFTLTYMYMPEVLAYLVVRENTLRMKEMVRLEVKMGHPDEVIQRIAKKLMIFTPADIEDEILAERMKRMRYTLSNIRALEEPSMGIDYSKSYVVGGFPMDVPTSLTMKIAIEQAMNHLKKKHWDLWRLLHDRYYNVEEIQHIAKREGISERTLYRRMSEAIERLVNIVERGVAMTIREQRIETVVTELNCSSWFDRSWFTLEKLRGIVASLYDIAETKYEMALSISSEKVPQKNNKRQLVG